MEGLKTQRKLSTVVLPCKCLGVARIRVKGKSRNLEGGQYATNIPIHTRNIGAENQDKAHGKGMRLHNVRVKDGRVVGNTCTVCGDMKAA